MANKTTYRVVSQTKFSAFLKRFSSIDPSLLVEIGEDNKIKAKTHTPDKAVVKCAKMGINEAFDFLDGTKGSIVFGLFNIDKFAGSFKQFGTENFDLIINHEEMDGLNIGTSVVLKSKKLTIRFDCASYRMFTHISDELFDTKIANGDIQTEFGVDKSTLTDLSSVCGIDSDHKFISLKSTDKRVFASGKSFDMEVLNGEVTLAPTDISFYKTHFGFVDKEDLNIKITDDKVIFDSSESDTVTVVGKTDED